ncbi:MAG: hypothetical protein M3P14_05140 [Chloroflexota bacterium]|nr:hypothetical protein [Chloroflexota bacterium]
MSDTDFSPEELRAQASGNQSALFYVVLDWALERDGSVDSWANFMGRAFAPGWEDMKGASAREVARMAGKNFASSADSRFVSLDGDETRGEAVIDGPAEEWLEGTKLSREHVDRANEVIFRRIAEYLGLELAAHRDEAGLHLLFTRA